MDDIYLPDEEDAQEQDEPVSFEKKQIEERPTHPSGTSPSDYVRLTFERFVTLVANHSFLDVVERNKDQEVIIPTNLLTDLANARRFSPQARGPLLLIGGLAVGILLGYFVF